MGVAVFISNTEDCSYYQLSCKREKKNKRYIKISQKNWQNYIHYLLLHLLLCLLSPSPSPSEEEEAEESLEEEEEEGRPVSLVMSTESATAARSGRFS